MHTKLIILWSILLLTFGRLPGQDCLVQSEKLNLHSGPGTQFPILQTLVMGDTLTVISQRGEWVLVSVHDSVGYVFKSHLESIAQPAGGGAGADTLFSAPISTNTQAMPVTGEVLVCISGNAVAYHHHYCKGLNRCTHEIRRVTMEEALRLGRTPCSYCFGW